MRRESDILSRLREFGVQGKLTHAMVEELVENPGFDQLTEFSCSDVSAISVHAMEQLKETGVMLRIISAEE